MVAVPGFYNQKRSAIKPHATGTGPGVGSAAGEGPRAMEDVTVEQNLEIPDKTVNAHLREKMDTFNAHINSGNNGYPENNSQTPNSPPHIPDHFNATNLGGNQHGNFDASWPINPTDPIEFNSINSLSECVNNFEHLEVAHANPKAHTSSPIPLSRESHETTRATKKNGTWTRMERSKSTQQIARAELSGPCKRKFSSVDDHAELPCNKKQVLEDNAELSSQMVEAVEQPHQGP